MAMPAESIAHSSIVETLVERGSFSTLVEAIKKADLAETLSSDGPFTVFAPTDEAFARLPADFDEALLHDKRALREVLKYHVVSGEITSSDVARLGSARSLRAEELSFYVEGGAVTVNGARFMQTDIACGNGIIHAIDRVLTQ
jgi:transforming growth factor-beta-induced protein